MHIKEVILMADAKPKKDDKKGNKAPAKPEKKK